MELHERCAQALAGLIANFDATSTTKDPESLVICSHAAPIITMGRVLTGNMPDDPTTPDFDTYTCSISHYERKYIMNGEKGTHAPNGTPDWKGGKGVGGGWTCRANAAVDHLRNGGERNWYVFVRFDTGFYSDLHGPGTSMVTSHLWTSQTLPSPVTLARPQATPMHPSSDR